MNPGPQVAIGTHYTWQPPEIPFGVQLPFEVVDRMLLEVMKGFGAVPRRGAEVGGFLVGNLRRENDRTMVRVEDFEPVPCEHAHGPSYALSGKDLIEWREALTRLQSAAPSTGQRIVGYFRSHTRDGLQLSAEDLALLDQYFPETEAAALIIKPFATRASSAGFFFREDGQFQPQASRLEFPFRRKEMGGGNSPVDRVAAAARFGQNRTAEDRATPAVSMPPQPVPQEANGAFYLTPAPSTAPAYGRTSELFAEPKPKSARSGWVWLPLSFIFMLLGVILGFQIAISMRPKTPANPHLEAWNLSVGVQRLDDRLIVSWDRSAPAVRNATRGVMTITAPDDNRKVDLSFSDLQAGQLIYRSTPVAVSFRLEVFPKERTSVSETLDYRQGQ